MDPYEVLGIRPGATREEVVAAYREKCKQHHPDVGGDAREFVRIQEAYESILEEWDWHTSEDDQSDTRSSAEVHRDQSRARDWSRSLYPAAIGIAAIVFVAAAIFLAFQFKSLASSGSTVSELEAATARLGDPEQSSPPETDPGREGSSPPHETDSHAQESNSIPDKPEVSEQDDAHFRPRARSEENLKIGRFLCFREGNWKEGLPKLADGTDDELRDIALADLAMPIEPAAQAALGNRWWTIAEPMTGVDRANVQRRAAYWYAQALPRLKVQEELIARRMSDAAPLELYLSDLIPAEIVVVSNIPFNDAVTVNGTSYSHGIYLHPPAPQISSRIAFNLQRKYDVFSGTAAMSDSMPTPKSRTAVTFRVVGDGKNLWTSRKLEKKGESQSISVNIQGIDRLELFVDCPGDHLNAHSVWVDPMVSVKTQPPSPAPRSIAIHRFNVLKGDHFYTWNDAELNALKGKKQFEYEGILGFAFAERQPNTVPLHRYTRFDGGNTYVVGSTPPDGSKQIDGPVWVYEDRQPGSEPVYRLAHPKNTKDVIFTVRTEELARLRHDWKLKPNADAIAFYVRTSQ